MKKIFKLMVVCMLTLGVLTGCSNSSSDNLKEVAIIQYVEHTSLNTIKDAFDKQMEKLGYKILIIHLKMLKVMQILHLRSFKVFKLVKKIVW